MEVTKWPYCVSVRCTPTVRPHTSSEVGLCCRDHVARQQYPLLAQWGDRAHIFKESKPFPLLLFRREASLTHLLYNPATEGVLEEQIRFARKQLMALTCDHWHTYSFQYGHRWALSTARLRTPSSSFLWKTFQNNSQLKNIVGQNYEAY